MQHLSSGGWRITDNKCSCEGKMEGEGEEGGKGKGRAKAKLVRCAVLGLGFLSSQLYTYMFDLPKHLKTSH